MNKKYTFTVSIMTLFAALSIVLSIFLLSTFYIRGMEAAKDAIESRNSEVKKNIIRNVTSALQNISLHLSVLAGSNNDEDVLKSKDTTSKIMWEQLKSDKYTASIFMGDNKGNFLQIRRTPALAIREIKRDGDVNGSDYWEFKDDNYKTVAMESSIATYDHRTRLWYKNALNNGVFYWTDPYVFASTGAIGITVALPKISEFGEKIKVVAADFTLETITKMLVEQAKQIDSELVIFSGNKEIISSSIKYDINTSEGKLTKVDQLKSTKFKKIFDSVQSNKLDGEVSDENGMEYLYSVSVLPTSFGKNWYLATIIEKEKVFQNVKQTIYVTIGMSLVIILLIIFVVWNLLNKWVIKPVKELKVMTNNVTAHDFDSVKQIDTRIDEFSELSLSMVSMASSIKQYQEDQKNLMEAFIKLIASAIDSKSPYTGGHCERVPELAAMLAKKVSDSDSGVFKEFKLSSEDEWREFRIGAWLHDCGKVTTPEYVVDKATKLETIYNRIHEIRTRFEVLYRDAIIDYYNELNSNPTQKEMLDVQLHKKFIELKEDFEFVAECNIGGEFLDDSKIKRLHNIANKTWIRYFDDRLGLSEPEMLRLKDIAPTKLPAQEKLLIDKAEHIISREREIDQQEYNKFGFKVEIPKNAYNYGELYNLSISRGTLTNEERFKINEHVIMSIKMLEELPFTANMRKIPEYAGAHHETMIGTGYPRKLTKEQISIPARIMAIADVFEALTASDRPYKKAKKLSEAIKIMYFMMKDQHIDPDLYEVFIREGIYKEYADKFLKPEQIDDVDIEKFL